MNSEPWARLMTRMMPNTSVTPTAIRNSISPNCTPLKSCSTRSASVMMARSLRRRWRDRFDPACPRNMIRSEREHLQYPALRSLRAAARRRVRDASGRSRRAAVCCRQNSARVYNAGGQWIRERSGYEHKRRSSRRDRRAWQDGTSDGPSSRAGQVRRDRIRYRRARALSGAAVRYHRSGQSPRGGGPQRLSSWSASTARRKPSCWVVTASPAQGVADSTMARLAARLADSGIVLLDMPLTRGEPAAEAGELLVMVGGDAEAFESCKPALASFASSIFHLGQLGAARSARWSTI